MRRTYGAAFAAGIMIILLAACTGSKVETTAIESPSETPSPVAPATSQPPVAVAPPAPAGPFPESAVASSSVLDFETTDGYRSQLTLEWYEPVTVGGAQFPEKCKYYLASLYGSTDLSVYSFETVRFKASLSSVDNNGFAWPATEKVVGEMRHLRNTVPIGDLCRLSESTPTQGIGSFLITTDTAATPIDYYMIYPTEVTPNNPEGTGDYDLNDLKMALYVQNKAGSCLVVSGNGINQGSSTCLVNYR